MNDFIFKHWSGEYSLARAYWVNGVLIGFLAYMFAIVAGAGLESLGEDRESILPVIYFFLILVNVWQTVGDRGHNRFVPKQPHRKSAAISNASERQKK